MASSSSMATITPDPAPTSSAVTPLTSSSSPPPPAQSWTSGWCDIHVKQRTYDSKRSALTVKIYDDDDREFGGDSEDGPNLDYSQPHERTSELP